MSILAPWMRAGGYGDYGRCPMHAATLVMRGSTPVGLWRVVLFPPDKSTVVGKMCNPEWPSPLAACPGYALPVGTLITVQLGAFVKVLLNYYAIEDESTGREVGACGFDTASYALDWGRRILVNYGAIVVVPRKPLVPGHTYRLTVQTRHQDFAWEFRVRKEHRLGKLG
jgi:hypothetical protein